MFNVNGTHFKFTVPLYPAGYFAAVLIANTGHTVSHSVTPAGVETPRQSRTLLLVQLDYRVPLSLYSN